MIVHSFIHDAVDVASTGRTIERTAVRAVIVREGLLLMVHSSVNGDHKFPGGGVEIGETHEHALRREVMEECGHVISRIGDKVGILTEYLPAKDDGYDTFLMNSHYYACEVSPEEQKPLQLDAYEADLQFNPVWISANDAIDANAAVIRSGIYPRWTPRDTYVLRELPGKNL